MKLTLPLLSCVVICMLWGCGAKSMALAPQAVDGWIVYWDIDRGLEELENWGDRYRRVSYFSLELAESGDVVLTKGIGEALPKFLDIAAIKGFEPWITIVNDVHFDDGALVQKDAKFIQKLLLDPFGRKGHVRKIAAAVKDLGVVGVHLDYEGISNEFDDEYREFISELKEELALHDVGLSIVVEPLSGPLPGDGQADTVVMGYALHGPHSGPGPIATPAFIASIGGRGFPDAESAPTLALMLGGYVWNKNGEVIHLLWDEVNNLENGSKLLRDNINEVPYAVLPAGGTVYYEDAASITSKWTAAYAVGFRKLMVWRIGGNGETFYTFLDQLKFLH